MSSILKVDQIQLADGSPATASGLGIDIGSTGKVLQVVNSVWTSQTDYTTTSWGDTGLSASITPSSTSSKIMVIVSHNEIARIGTNSPSSNALSIKIQRNGNDWRDMGDELLYFIQSTQLGSQAGFIAMPGPTWHELDSPATTSQLTYKTQAKNINSINGVRVKKGQITLMEIAG